MKFPCTGVILAGGENKRFHGKNKAFSKINGKRTIDRIFEVFTQVFADIILVTNDPARFVEWDATIVSDVLPVRSSLTGIHAGLFYAKTSHAFFSACDTPFLKKELVLAVIAEIEDRYDAVMPETAAGMEPLCAVYTRRCLHRMEQKIMENKLKIQRIFKNSRMKRIPESTIRKHDPDLDSFFNINTPEDLLTAETMAKTRWAKQEAL